MSKEKKPPLIESLDDYLNWVTEVKKTLGRPVFRGFPYDGKNFKNNPATSRDIERLQGDLLSIQRKLIDQYKLAGYNDDNLSDLEILAKIQHAQGRTALIDYSFNSLIALFFAVLDTTKDGWVIVTDINDIMLFKNITASHLKENDENTIEKIFNNDKLWYWELPRIKNPRMMAQQAIFLFGKVANDEIPYNEKYFIDKTSKPDIKKALNELFDINTITLFPDFEGWVKYFEIKEEKSAKDYFNDGNAKYQAGDYAGAIKDYDKAIELNPQDAGAYINRGVAKGMLGQDNEAIEDFTQVILLYPKLAIAYNNRGNAQNNLSQHIKAIEDFNQALKLNPQYASAYNNRGFAKDHIGQHKEAIQDYNQTIKLDAKFIEAYVNRGAAKGILGQYEEAIEDFNQAIKLDSGNIGAYVNRGLANSELQKYKEAISDFNKAIELNPQYTDAYYNRGEAKIALKKYEEAIEDFKRAICRL